MPVKEEIILDFMPNGEVVCSWWTRPLQKLASFMRLKDAKGFEHLNKNPWCG